MQNFPRLSCTLAVFLSIMLLPAFATAQQVASSDLPQAPSPQQEQQARPVDHRGEHEGILSNYGSVSVNEKLPPQTAGEKFKMAIKDDFGPSTFVIRAAVAGADEARNSIPEFHEGGAGFGRYYWHSLADSAVENTLVEFVVRSEERRVGKEG